MHAGDNRALAWATLASLALHALLVVGWPRLPERLRPAPAPPIVSRIVAPPTPEPPRAAAPAPAPAPAPKPRPAVEKKPRPEKPAARPAERATEPQPMPAPREEVAEAKAAAEAPPPAAAAAPAPAPATAPAQPAKPALDAATTISQYRMQVLSAARRLKGRYPDIARENNWSGSVVITLAVGADGAADVKLKSGTGHPPLDEQAADMFRRAARAVPVPPALHGRAFSIELKALYGLVD